MSASDRQPAFVRASRLSGIAVSGILRIAAEAKRLREAGIAVISLSAGEPDFDTPENIKEAATRAMRDGLTKYTHLDGGADLKEAVRQKFSRENNLTFSNDEITCSAGAKQVLFNAFMATLEPGDEVLLPTPYWTSYADIVAVCGGRAVPLPCLENDSFLLSPEALEAAISTRTRWLVLNSPSNPSGAVYDAASLGRLMTVLDRHSDVWLLCDDIYEHILYDGRRFVTAVEVAPDMRDRTLIVNGVSKAYAMTGWRLGYGGGPRPLIEAMAVVQSQSTSCPSSISQAAAIEALTGSQAIVADRRNLFQRRRDVVVAAMNGIDGIVCPTPGGAFYAYANCSGVLGRKTPDGNVIETDEQLCRYLLDEARVAVVPGSCFGLSPYFRLSYAVNDADLVEAGRRISEACGSLRI